MHETNFNKIVSDPVAEYENLLEICRSFMDAAEDGHPNGKRASANGRFRVKDCRSAGYDEFGHHDGYSLAGVLFDHYESGMVEASYPLGSRMRTKFGEMTLAECVVFMVCEERYGINLVEYVEDVLGNDRKAA